MNLLVVVPALIPTVQIGIIKPFEALKKRGLINIHVVLTENFELSILTRVECVIFCRNSDWNEEHILEEVIKRNIPYIYEIDDDLFETPATTTLGKFHRHPLNISALKNFLHYASLVRLYSPLMAENVCLINNNIEINHTYFNQGLIEGVIPNDKTDRVKIIYATSRVLDEQQSIFSEALKRIAKEFSGVVEIYFWGADISDVEFDAFSNVFHLQPINDYTVFIKKFYSMGFDIGLAPIFGERFYNSKTNNKYREYGGCNIAGVYSDELLYRNCVTDRKNGLLVKNTPNDWYGAIKLLIENPELRKEIIKNAHQDIVNNYSFESFCDGWLLSINKAISNCQNLPSSGLLPRGGKLTCVLYYDYSSIDFCVLKDRLMHDVYLNSFVSIGAMELEDEVKNDLSIGSVKNIIVVSDDHEVFSYFCEQCMVCKDLRVLFISHFAYSSDALPLNLKIFQIPFESDLLKNIYAHFSKNIYVKINETLKVFFIYDDIPVLHKKIFVIEFLRKIKRFLCGLKMPVHKKI